VPVIELSTPAIVVANVVAWGAIHAGTGYLVHRLPVERLQRDGWLLRERRLERGGRRYERAGIRRWKDRLPEAGAVFAGGRSKRSIPGGRAGLERFMVETRRAEVGHWLAMAGGPLSALWNPPLGAVLMVAYGVMVNVPFIAIQRYNRMRASRVRRRSTDRSRTSTLGARSADDAP
jgi:glycosyl-4,4'-diaponeurosporenoate acyltransferase